MKKFLSLIALSVFTYVSFTYAKDEVPPFHTYARCVWDVEQAARAAGLKNPWGVGGDINAWKAFTLSKYNLCSCKYFGRPINELFNCEMFISSISGDDTKP